MEHLSLLAGGGEHPRVTREQWEKAAADVLRKAGRLTDDDPDDLVWSKLTRTTLDGIDVPPLGLREHLDGLPPTGEPGVAPYTRGSALTRPDEGWDVRVHLADPDAKQAAADALTDLENGATSLWLRLGRGGLAISDLPTVLEKVYVDLAPVVLDCPEDPVGAAEALRGHPRRARGRPGPGHRLGRRPVERRDPRRRRSPEPGRRRAAAPGRARPRARRSHRDRRHVGPRRGGPRRPRAGLVAGGRRGVPAPRHRPVGDLGLDRGRRPRGCWSSATPSPTSSSSRSPSSAPPVDSGRGCWSSRAPRTRPARFSTPSPAAPCSRSTTPGSTCCAAPSPLSPAVSVARRR